MDFHEVGKNSSFHVLSTTSRSSADTGPMQFVSRDQLAHYQALEAAVRAFVAAVGAVGPAPALAEREVEAAKEI